MSSQKWNIFPQRRVQKYTKMLGIRPAKTFWFRIMFSYCTSFTPQKLVNWACKVTFLQATAFLDVTHRITHFAHTLHIHDLTTTDSQLGYRKGFPGGSFLLIFRWYQWHLSKELIWSCHIDSMKKKQMSYWFWKFLTPPQKKQMSCWKAWSGETFETLETSFSNCQSKSSLPEQRLTTHPRNPLDWPAKKPKLQRMPLDF